MIVLNAKTTEYISYAASSITFLDSISTDYIKAGLAITGIVCTFCVNLYFTWREDRRKEEEHEQFMVEHRAMLEQQIALTKKPPND